MRFAAATVKALLLITIGCAPAAPAGLSVVERTAIEAHDQSYGKLLIAGDAAALVASHYTADAIVLLPNRPEVSGAAAIEAMVRASAPVTSFSTRTEEVIGAGDVAVVRGRYVRTVAPIGMTAFADSGKYLEVFKRQVDGSWKCYRDMISSDVPRATAERAKR